jgi:hypothetical protein
VWDGGAHVEGGVLVEGCMVPEKCLREMSFIALATAKTASASAAAMNIRRYIVL